MNALTICFAAVGIAVTVSVVKHQKADFGAVLTAAAAVILFSAILKIAEPLFSFIKMLGEQYGVGSYIGIMLRALGIAICSRVCSEICKDCGENSIAMKIETAGKIGIMLISLPLIEQLVKGISGLL